MENVDKLKEAINKEIVLFGIRQCLKNKNTLEEVFVAGRKETEELLNKEGIKFLKLNISREEITKKLGLKFNCEVFSVLKAKAEAPRKKEKKQKKAKGKEKEKTKELKKAEKQEKKVKKEKQDMENK